MSNSYLNGIIQHFAFGIFGIIMVIVGINGFEPSPIHANSSHFVEYYQYLVNNIISTIHVRTLYENEIKYSSSNVISDYYVRGESGFESLKYFLMDNDNKSAIEECDRIIFDLINLKDMIRKSTVYK